MKYNMNDKWYFTKTFTTELFSMSNAELEGLKEVRIPHTVQEMELNYCDENDYQMESAYVRHLYAEETWKGKKVFLTFGAAAHEAEVFCNGISVCTHRCGYTAFTVDLSEVLTYGEENRIVVRLDSQEHLNIPPFGNVIDYMTFGGIYRNVILEIKEQSYLKNVFVHGGTDKILHIEMEGEAVKGCTISAEVKDRKGTVLAELRETAYQTEVEMKVEKAQLWDINQPNLYTCTIFLRKNGEEMDRQCIRFGFRTVEFRETGFFLNGKRLKIRGLNRHQSWPYMGYAVPDRAQRLDADILKRELGCNAVRTSHYPQSHAFLERCDEIGLLVFTEIPGWQHIGNQWWKNQAVRNTEEMILEYRNHTSIFLWGVRINESQDDDELYEKTNAAAHRLDPTRPTGGVRCMKKSNLLEDVYTYNDFYHNGTNDGCEPKRKITSDMKKGYFVSEYNGHMFPTKSFDWEGKRTEHALRHAKVIHAVNGQKEIAGSFGWCMADYNTHQDFGSGDRVCYHGVLDMFRNPKMAAAVYAAEGLKKPVLEISSSLDIGEYPACNLGNVYAFTNADYVELYKNEEFIARFQQDKTFSNMKHAPVLIDDTVGCLLEKNEGMDKRTAEVVKIYLKAIAKYGQDALPPKIVLLIGKLMLTKNLTYAKIQELYGKYMGTWGGKSTTWRFCAVKDGKVTAETVKAPSKNPRLDVIVDTKRLKENGAWDMATVRIRAVDENGNLLPYCARTVSLSIEGEAEIIGPECVPLMGGMTGTYIRTVGKAGRATLAISAPGMKTVKVEFEILK